MLYIRPKLYRYPSTMNDPILFHKENWKVFNFFAFPKMEIIQLPNIYNFPTNYFNHYIFKNTKIKAQFISKDFFSLDFLLMSNYESCLILENQDKNEVYIIQTSFMKFLELANFVKTKQQLEMVFS